MKNRIHKILGVGITLVIAMALVMGFAAPVAAAETINEWYTFDYPVEGELGDWFYDPEIDAIGPMAEAINGDVYAATRIHAELGVWGNNYSAVWSIEQAHSGSGSAKLTCTNEANIAMAKVPLNCPLDDISSTSDLDFSYYIPATEAGNCPSLLLGIDTDGNYMVDRLLIQDHCPPHSGTDVWYTDNLVESSSWTTAGYDPKTGQYAPGVATWGTGGWQTLSWWKTTGHPGANILFVAAWLSRTGGNWGTVYVDDISVNCMVFDLEPGRLFKSTDGARTWAVTGYEEVDLDPSTTIIDPPGPIKDMVCSSIDEDIIYVTDGNYVYKSSDGGDEFAFVKRDSLEEQLEGACGCDITGYPITSIDVAYDDNDNPYVFIGTQGHYGDDEGGCANDDWFDGSVYWIGEAGYPSNWSDMNLSCYSTGDYDALAVGCAPDWADTNETYVVVTNYFETHVVITTGGPCDWPEFAELKYNCATPFGSMLASRIAFPDDWEDTETLFVGIVDAEPCSGPGGDVYMVMDGSALDMNVAGITSGCIGIQPVDIISLDIEGDTDEARLIAGAFCDTNVYCSEDGGWSWDVSAKDPTGVNRTYVLWYGDSALAATAGYECAVSMCCGEEYPCEFWNQISLISTDIDCVRYIDHSPGYVCGDSETMFMLTSRSGDGPCGYTQSVFRHDGTYWERVYSSTIAGADSAWDQHIFWRLQVSPDFNTTSAVYLWDGCFEMWRTLDAGCSWTKLTFPCTPRPCIREAVVIDEDTVIAGGMCCHLCCDGAAGYVYKTTRHGARPWSEYEFDATHEGDVVSFALEPGYKDPGSVLLGDDESRVYISEDGGETWDLVSGAKLPSGTYDTWVAFDPAYATSGIIYAAAGLEIHRCVIDPDADWADQTWEVICDNLGYAAGIKAAGDTALYVTDDDMTEECLGNPKIDHPCCYDGVADYGGVLRSLNPDAEDAGDVIFERLAKGLPANGDGAELWNLWLTCDTSDEGCVENVLWSIDKTCSYGGGPDVWIWEDTLAAPVVLAMPVDAQKLTTTDSVTLSWNELCGADCYEVALWKYCAECPDEKLDITVCGDCAAGTCCVACPELENGEPPCIPGVTCCTCHTDTCIVVGPAEIPVRDADGPYYWGGLEPGTEYFWQVRVCQCQPFLSKWSEERTFMTALVQVVDLCSPVCGGQDIILTPNFSWDAVPEATGYDIELAPTETFTAGVVRGSSTVNAWVAPEDLEYATTYYWRVRAEKDGVFSDWTVCIFTTMEKPVAPTPPVTITPAPPAPQINIPPAEMITPNWIYAIIGIGAALCVVVIVLIVRTRRPPA